MEKRIIARGILAGAIGGVVAFLFARVLVEPVIGRAIDFEDSHTDHMDHMDMGHTELFSRAVQANIGMGFGVLAFGIAMGALFAVVFAVTFGRLGAIGPRALSVLIATGAFAAVYLVPFLKYPANPPAVGRMETIGERTGLYLVMVLASVAFAIAAVWLGRHLTTRLGAWNATLVGGAGYVLAVAVVMLVLPAVAETPEHFPANDLYDFRLYSVGTQLVLWATIGLVFASLADRLLRDPASRSRATASRRPASRSTSTSPRRWNRGTGANSAGS
jgi:Probable cobalt transporter subunit (CbtA)